MLQHVLSKFQKDDVNRLQRYKRTDSSLYTGPNKRLSRMVPPPCAAEDEVKAPARHLMQRKFMLSLAVHERTCCLHISSAWRRSRASVLILRGKVLGCIYTRKDLGSPIFGEAGYSLALADLGEVDTQISAYEIDESIALASAAIFSRHTQAEEPTREVLAPSDEYKKFVDANASGCIFLNDEQSQTVCRVYVRNGAIVGVYANVEGWLKQDIKLVDEMVQKNSNLACESFLMRSAEIQEIYADGFPVSSETSSLVLIDCAVRKTEKRENLFANYINTANRQCSLLSDKTETVDVQQQMIEQVTGFANRIPAIKHAHAVNPLL